MQATGRIEKGIFYRGLLLGILVFFVSRDLGAADSKSKLVLSFGEALRMAQKQHVEVIVANRSEERRVGKECRL